MSDSEMFPFEPEKVMGSEGHEAEQHAEERRAEAATEDVPEDRPTDTASPDTASPDAASPDAAYPDAADLAVRNGDRPQSVLGESWDDALARLRGHFPETKEGILFCVYKLLQDQEANFKEFRDEAQTRGIALSGRSLHSAKVLLGMAQPAKRKPKNPAIEVDVDEAPPSPAARAAAAHSHTETRRPTPRKRMTAAGSPPSVEDALRHAVAQIEEAAQSENARLKDAIRQAIDVLSAALDD